MKKFFGIEEQYQFEWGDLSTLLTILNVSLIIAGWYWAPMIGIVNIGISLVLNVINHAHINMYVMNLALLIMNIYFLA